MSDLPFHLRKIHVVPAGDRVRIVVRDGGGPIDLPFHPLADVFPILDVDQLKVLADDIRKNGLRQPIMMLEGKVLDGRNRLAACSLADVKPRFKNYDGDDPLGYVISLNMRRRHLDDNQRAMIAAEIAKLPKGANQHASTEAPSQAKAAAMMNVSRATVQRARQVIDKGTPELVAAVKKGAVSVSAAAKAVSPIAKKTAAKYVAQQEAKLGPVTPAPKISKELATVLKGKKASLTVWTRQLQGSGIPAVVEALASAIEVIEQHLIP